MIKPEDFPWDDFKAQIEVEDWEEGFDGSFTKRIYIGSVLGQTPSGCLYAPWARSNVTDEEIEKDVEWWQGMIENAAKIGCEIGQCENDWNDIVLVQHKE